MKKLAISTAVFAALSLTGTAQAYQFELNGGAAYTNVTTHNTHEHDEMAAVGGSATVYLKNVDTKTGPLAEAAFINQASSITGGYAYAQTDGNSSNALKGHIFNGGGEFYVPTSLLGLGDALPVTLYAAGGATRAKIESNPSNGFGYTAEVGFIPNKLPYNLGTLLLTAGVAGSHDNLDSELDPTVRAKLLTKFYQNDINLEAHAQFGGSNKSEYGNKYNIAGFSADFYVDNTFSVGGGYDRTFINGTHDPFNVNLNARKFIMENVSLQAGIDFGKGEGDDNNLGASVGGTLRF